MGQHYKDAFEDLHVCELTGKCILDFDAAKNRFLANPTDDNTARFLRVARVAQRVYEALQENRVSGVWGNA